MLVDFVGDPFGVGRNGELCDVHYNWIWMG